ncbi:MAG: hypothetical protein ACLQOO_18385 [Terriglobia bacterium]
MGKDKDTKPPTLPTTPITPPVCPGDVAVSDCKQAVIFSEKTPSFAEALATAQTAAKKATDNPGNQGAARAAAATAANLHCDFKAVWTYVPPPPQDQVSVLIYFHGNDNWVRLDDAGNCIVPDWWQDGDPIAQRNPRTKAVTPARDCAPKGYGLAATAEDNHKPIVIAPEDMNPVNHTPTAEGSSDKAALGDLIEDCFKHLSDTSLLTKKTSCGGGPYLTKKPALTDIKRLFVSGHSGGGKPLAKAAASNVAISLATDLCLLDCTYGWGTAEYVDYCKTKKASLGNAAGQSRLLCFYLGFPIRDENVAKDSIRKQLEDQNKKNAKFNDDLPATNAARAARHPPLPPLSPKPIVTITDDLLTDKWRKQWFGSTKQHVEDDIIPGLKGAGFKFDTSLSPPAPGKSKGDAVQIATGNFTDVETACRSYPIVFVALSGVEHDSFPTRLIPVMLKTASVV